MKSILLILALGSFGIAAEPSRDTTLPPRTAVNEVALKTEEEAQSPIPEELASKEGVTVQVDLAEKDGVVFLLINNTDKPLYFRGSWITSPWYRLKIPWNRGEFAERLPSRTFCGGPILPKLLAKHCCRFKLSQFGMEPKFCVGVDFWHDEGLREDQKATAWSVLVNKKGEQATPSDADMPSN